MSTSVRPDSPGLPVPPSTPDREGPVEELDTTEHLNTLHMTLNYEARWWRRADFINRIYAHKIWCLAPTVITFTGGAKIWYKDGEGPRVCVTIFDKKDTLAARILRYQADIPKYDEDMVIYDDVGIKQPPSKFYFPAHPSVYPARPTDSRADPQNGLPIITVVDNYERMWVPKDQALDYLRLCRGAGRSRFLHEVVGQTPYGELVFPHIVEDLLYNTLNFYFVTPTTVKSIMVELVEAVTYLHAQGLVHKANLHAADIGWRGGHIIIKNLHGMLTSATHRAPEVRRGQKATTASDVFALGRTLWEVCTSNNLPPLFPFQDLEVMPEFNALYHACTAEVPAARPLFSELSGMFASFPDTWEVTYTDLEEE